MKFLKRWLIVLQIVFLLLQTAFTLSSNISCSAGIATLGGQARITCFFDRDIGSSKQNFVIWRYPLDTTDLDDSTYRKDVLRGCNWLEGGSKELDCLPNKGYEFHKQTVTTTASVDIPSATADQEGIYKCQLVTQEIIPTSTCNLTVQATERNGIDNFISALTPQGAFGILVGTIVLLIIAVIVIMLGYFKYMLKRRREKTAKIEIRTVDRSTNTNPVAVECCVDIAVNTDESSFFASKGKFWSKKDDKKTTSKQSTSKQPTPKRSQEDMTGKEEETPLLPATAPPQYGPTTDAKANDGQPTQEAVGGPSEAGAEVIDTKRVEIQMASGNTDDTAQDNTETDQNTAQNDNGKSKEKGKGRKGISLFKKK